MSKMFKRLGSFLLAMMMVLSLLPINAFAAETNAVSESEIDSFGTWGGIDWTLTTDGTLTIAPTQGEPTKLANKKTTFEVGQWPEAVRYNSRGEGAAIEGWPYNRTKVKSLVIEEGVTSIGSFAAQGFTNLTGEVVIPSTVTYIGQEAFQSSTMEKLTFAEGGTENLTIAQGALKNLIIEEIEFPADRPAIYLKAWVLNNCDNLKHVTFPANVKSFNGTNLVDYYYYSTSHNSGNYANTLCYNDAVETVTFGSEEVKELFFSKHSNVIVENTGTKTNKGRALPQVACVGLTYGTSLEAITEVAQSGDTIKLLKNTDEAVEIPAGVTLDLNGCTASNVTVAKPAVAQIGETPYESLTKAIAAAQAGQTITFVADITEDVTISKAVTIDGAGKTYTGAMTLKADTTIKNVNFDGKGYNGYAVNTRGAQYVTIEDCTVKNYGYGFAQLPSATALTTVKNVTVSGVNYGIKVDYSSAVVLENVDITAGVAAVLNSNYGEKTITIKDSKLSILGTYTRNSTIKTKYVFEGANTVDQFIIEEALDSFKLAAGATLTAPNAVTVTTVEDYEVKYENGVYTSVAKPNDVVVIGTQGYESLTAALAAANAGDTITFLADITEDVTISKAVTIDGAGKTYTGAMELKADSTIKNVNFDGKGYNGYAVTTRGASYVTIEDCTAKNYGYGFVQLASATALTTVKNVTASNMNYGVKVDYSGAVVLEEVDFTAGVAAVLNSNYGEKTITIKNSKLNILGTWTRNNTTKTNYVFEGANTIDSFIIDAAIDTFKLAAGATLTAPNAVTVTTVDDYEVKYENGTYTSVVKPNDVVKIGETGYATLAKAIAEAQAGDTITFLADITENVTINKNLTIDGADKNYTGTMTINNVTVTIENVNFVKGQVYKNKNTGSNAKITIKNCDFDGQGMDAYAINLGGTSSIVIENVTAKDYGYGLLQVPSSCAGLTVKNVTVSGCYYGLKVDYANAVAIENADIDATVGIYDSNYGTKTYTIKNSTISSLKIWERNTTYYTTFKFVGVNKVATLATSAYAKYVLGAADATLTAPEGATVTTDVANSGVVYKDGKYQVVGNVAKIGDATYTSLADAIKAATAGQTITFLADITEDVTISKAVAIDGAGKTFTGKMTLKADTTIKNVNFDGKGYNGYAVETRGANYVTIEDCTAKNYGYGFVQLASATVLTTVKNVTVSNMNYGVKIDYSSAVVLENVDLTANVAAVLNSNYGEKTITIKDSKLNILGTWTRNNTTKTNYVFEGENTVAVLSVDAAVDNFKLAVGATLAAPEGFTVTTDVADCEVEYKDGVYAVVESNYAAKIDNVKYATLAEALAAAKAGDTITLYANIASSEIITINKAITLDGNGFTLTSTAGRAINVSGANGVTIKSLTIKASGERAINIIQNATNVTIDNVTATAENYTVNVASSAPNAVVTIENSTLNGLCTVNVAAAGANVAVKKSTVNCNDNNTTEGESYAALSLNKEAIGGSIVATDTTVNVAAGSDSVKGRNGAEGGTVTINGSTDEVAVIVAVITYDGQPSYHGFYSLASAIEFAKDGDVITLIRDVKTSKIIEIGKAITLDGNGKTLTSTAARAINIETTGKVVISNLTINAGERAINIINKASTVELNNVTATAKNNAVMIATSAGAVQLTINDSNLTGLAVVNVSGAGSNVAINNTTITNKDASSAEQYGAITVWSSAAAAKVTVTGGSITVADDSRKAYVFPGDAEVYGVDDVGYIVATIGDAGFETLASAINKAKAGETIKLLRDVTASEIITINKAITLDGNGKTLTSTAGRAINVSGANGVTIKNLTINATGERAINIIQNATNVTIENVTATAANYTVNVASSAPAAVVTINGSTLNGLCTVNVASEGAQVTIDNSTINCNDNITTVGESYAALGLNKDAVGAKITATGCTINVDAGSDSVKARNGAEGGVITIDGKTDEVNVVVAIITYANSNNYHAFYTLASAVEFANAGDTITLIRDIAVSEGITNTKKITLDLNGKTITGTDNATGSFAIITNKGELTITGNGKMTLTATNNRGWNAYSSVISNTVGGKLIVESGTIEHLGGTDMAYAIDNLTNGKGTYAETIINGGTIKSTYRAIRMFLNGIEAQNILTVNGGVIEGTNKSIWVQDPSAKNNTGKITVAAGAVLNGDVYLYATAGSAEWPVEVSIAASAVKNEVITGNLPDGYILEKKSGNWTVNEYFFKVGSKYYTDLQKAVNAANQYQSVQLLQDAEGAGVVINKKTTIDFAGFTYTITAPVGSKGTESNGFQILAGNYAVRLLNGTLKVADSAADKFYILVQNYADLTVQKMTLDGTNLDKWSKTDGDSYTLSNNSGNVNINMSTIIANNDGDKAFAFDVCDKTAAGYELPRVVVYTGSKIEGKIEAVAKVGNYYYATLQQAVDATAEGKTITLLAPIVVNAGETLNLNKKVTISYTSNVAGEDMITNRGTVIVDGATLVYKNTDKTASNVTVSTISCEPGSELEVKNGVVKNNSANNGALGIYAYAIDMLTNGSLGDVTATISGGQVICTNYMAIRQFNNGNACKNTLNVTGGYIYGAKRAIQIHFKNNAAYLNISGGEIEAGDYALCLLTTSENIEVTGGEFKGAIWYSGTDAFITGGTFDVAMDEAYIVDGYKMNKVDGVYNVIVDTAYGKVATIGDKGYKTLAEAWAAAQNGDTIVLQKNIAIDTETFTVADGKKITLDMNGYTITVSDNSTKNYELFYIYGEMVVTGKGTIEMSATNDRDWNASSSIFHNRGGVFTIENGTFTHNGGTDMAYVVDNSGNYYGEATTNIMDGELTSAYIAIRNRMEQNTHGASGKAILNVYGGAINGTSRAIWAQAASTSTVAPATGEINIFGGEIGLIDTARSNGAVSMTTITGGTVAAFKGESGELKVAGGTITGDITICFADGEVAEKIVKKSNVYYAAVAKINKTYYATLADAIKANTGVQAVTLIRDVEASGFVVTKKMSLDLNGHTLTLTAPVGDTGCGIQINTSKAVRIVNGTLKAADNAGINVLIENNGSALTIQKQTIEAAGVKKVLVVNSGSASLNYATINAEGAVAFEVNGTAKVTVYTSSKISGTIDGKKSGNTYSAKN